MLSIPIIKAKIKSSMSLSSFSVLLCFFLNTAFVDASLTQLLQDAPDKIQKTEDTLKKLNLDKDKSCLQNASSLEEKKECLGRLFKKIGRLDEIAEDLISSSFKPGLLVKLSQLITLAKPYEKQIDEIGRKIYDFLGDLNFLGFLLVGFESSIPSNPAEGATSEAEIIEPIIEV